MFAPRDEAGHHVQEPFYQSGYWLRFSFSNHECIQTGQETDLLVKSKAKMVLHFLSFTSFHSQPVTRLPPHSTMDA